MPLSIAQGFAAACGKKKFAYFCSPTFMHVCKKHGKKFGNLKETKVMEYLIYQAIPSRNVIFHVMLVQLTFKLDIVVKDLYAIWVNTEGE